MHLNFTFYAYIDYKDYCSLRAIWKQVLMKDKMYEGFKTHMTKELL